MTGICRLWSNSAALVSRQQTLSRADPGQFLVQSVHEDDLARSSELGVRLFIY
jgi:hypothetical protein